jgi:monoamine oxidase
MQTRREFIKTAAMALPAMSLASILLSSCSKSEIIAPKKKPRVGIIGAGISGLQTAKILFEQNQFEVEILEAGDKIGGRINLSEKVFGTCNIEMGASAAYGDQNQWFNMLRTAQTIETNSKSPSSFYINGNSFNLSELNQDSDYQKMINSTKDVCDYNGSSDVSVAQYIESKNIPERVKFIFQNRSEEKIGTSIERASIALNSSESLSKIDSNMYYISGTNSDEILYREYSKILPYVLNNTAICSIDYTGNKVKVRDHNQVLREYDYVVVTVPVSILKLQDSDLNSIKFLPALPESKISAMNKIGMDGAIKIALKTNRKFWHEGSKAIYTKGPIGKYEIVSEDPTNNTYILTATVMGAFAENELNSMRESEILNLIQNEWATYIGTSASDSLVSCYVKNWSKEPFIKGAFSYHKLGGEAETRKELAKSVNSKIFFAGEACNTNKNSGTVHGAIETAFNVSKEIVSLAV